MNADKLKSLISKKAQGNSDLSLQYYQMFFFEHILMRLEKSKYKDKIILKGGLLLASIIGEDFRTTKDMDATLKSIELDKDIINEIFTEILNIDIHDNIIFEIENVKDIRDEDPYGGFQINIWAKFERLKVHIAIELTSGDIITPREMKYQYNRIFGDEIINIVAYPIETMIAEKFETFISRGLTNTRMKDYYDLFVLINDERSNLNKKTLVKAIENTFRKRKTNFDIEYIKEITADIKADKTILNHWHIYQQKVPYAKDINYESIMDALNQLIDIIISELSKD